MAEPVDGLVLVAHREELGVRAAERFDELQLDAVRVLELVDHDVGGTARARGLELLGGRKHLDGEELEVREVEAGAGVLQLGVAARRRPRGPAARTARASSAAFASSAVSGLESLRWERSGNPTSGRLGRAMPWLRRRSWAARTMSLTADEAKAALDARAGNHAAALKAESASRSEDLEATLRGLGLRDLELQSVRAAATCKAALPLPSRTGPRRLIVDEFQDTNQVQLELMDRLRGPDTHLVTVGDRRRSI